MITGSLEKMIIKHDDPADYFLPIGSESVHLNPRLGKNIRLEFQQLISCTACGRETRKSFGQGYCYPCFTRLAQCDICIVKPERCHYAQGTCREPDWAQQHCFQPHYVYLSNTSGIKVGITRASQIPTRWLDQGASSALKILEAKNRHISGLAEIAISKHVADKTDWRRMLKGEPSETDLHANRDRLLQECVEELDVIRKEYGADALVALEDTVWSTHYPIVSYPSKVSSLNFDKQATISGTLMGLKGQYLILDSGVINIRKFSGYHVSLI